MTVKYVVHPVSSDEKRAFDCKVIDARFAPKGVEIFKADGQSLTAKPKAKKPKKAPS